jgi:hypothetical protein
MYNAENYIYYLKFQYFRSTYLLIKLYSVSKEVTFLFCMLIASSQKSETCYTSLVHRFSRKRLFKNHKSF